ncbi:uncharacterized protein NPIL_173361 [Nephila pilipes]|uniref:Uncharacterized protein n=1 Tax=Nephila pilipes TaxID=299642 RepID=A0A8X6UNT3_NEPPI|nr:uncharacterized protein NPIL_173361 [Nephila pilipes]
MDFSSFFLQLYDGVLTKEKKKFYVNDNRIRDAIRNMKEAYKPNPEWESDKAVLVANYSDAAHRCAYVHKYALCYTGMVCDILQDAIRSEPILNEFFESKRRLTLCSLGGGPGTDIVGVFAAFISTIGFIPCSVTVLDYAREWESTFKIVIQELQRGHLPIFTDMTTPPSFNYEYIGCNLLTDVTSKLSVKQAVASADFLTMIKFISAAGCNHTRVMVENVFRTMKPGAILLFIDNAAGGFQSMAQEVANRCGMITVFGPLLHYDYEKTDFSITRFGYTSQSKTKMAVQIWRKPLKKIFSTSQDLRNQYYQYNRNSRAEQNWGSIRLQSSFIPESARPQTYQERNENGCCSII